MSRTILLVDDSKMERVVLTGFLKSEYNLIEAVSGEEAIEILRIKYKTISAVVLDIVMPGMDGFETLKIIKANTLWLSIPVVITTGLDDDASREKAIACGADNFVTKPFNQKLLMHIVQNAIKLRETAVLANTIYRDNMTGLLNRESFYTEAARMIQRHRDGYFMLSSFDVENFKVINDLYGTDTGDKVLLHIAGRIGDFASGNNGLACRYMGDKFALLFPAHFAQTGEIEECHRQMTAPACLKQPIRVRVGRYLVVDRALPVSAMYDRALLAENTIKGRIDVYHAEYTEKMREELLREQEIVNEMASALANGEFEPWYQPQYNHATGALIGAEALVRWRRDGKIVPPYLFISVFEKNGFIYEVDQCVWRQVCRQLRLWLDQGKNPMPVSVNISRYDLYQSDFMDVLCALVRECDLPKDLLRLEITESAFSDSTSLITDMAEALIAQGFTLEIDDFGSGYSSLNTLKDVPANILKLDMRFFEATKNNVRGGNIVESVVRMAKWLGMAVIAEGVEDREQADYLKSIGCYYIQGYFYSRPIPALEYEKLLAANPKEPKLARLITLETLNNNEFWNPKSMETLIFNSYVGGACIFELADGKTELLRINDQYISELRGIIPDGAELKDCSLFRFFSDESKAGLWKMLNAASAQAREASCELRLTNGAQTEYVRLTARVIARADARLLYYGVIVNLTEQRMSEKAALDASERIQAIMDNTQCGITAFVIAPDGKVERLFVNDRYYELLGYTETQCRQELKTPFDCILPEDRERIVTAARRLIAVGQSAALQMRAVRRDGRVIWLRGDISIVEFATVPYPVQLASFLDITEQVEAERKRLESAEQLKIIMSNINGSVSAFLLDEMGNTQLIFGNDNYYGIFGYTKAQAEEIRLDTMSCIIPEDFDMVVEKLRRLKDDGVPIDIDYRGRKRDGSLMWTQVTNAVISLAGVGDTVLLAIVTDVTALRLAEKQSMEATDRLKAVMNAMTNGVTAVAFHGGHPQFLFANERYYQLHGVAREGIALKELSDSLALVSPEDRERLRELVRNTASIGQTGEMEYRILRPDGRVLWAKVAISVTSLSGVNVPVQVSIFSDIQAQKEAARQLDFLNSTAHAILAQPEIEAAINGTLERINGYFRGDRTYVIELDAARKVTRNTYEFCAPGVQPQKEHLQDVAFDPSDFWFDALSHSDYLVIDDVAAMDESRSRLRDLLASQNIRSIIVAALRRDGRLIGFAGTDNPSFAMEQVSQLTALSVYIAVLLTRRDLKRSFEHEKKNTQQLMDDTPGGFCRMAIRPGKPPTLANVNGGFCRMLDMTEEEVFAAYGEDVLKCLAAEDIFTASEDSADAAKDGGQFITKCRLRTKGESLLWVMVFARFVKDENGECFLNAYFTGITAEKNAEQHQIELLDNLPTGAALYEYYGKEVKVVHINRRYWKLVEREPVEYGKASVFNAIHPGDRALTRQEIESAIRQTRNAEADCRLLCGNGGYKPFHISANIAPKDGGGYTIFASYAPISDEAMSIQEMLPIALSAMVASTDDMSYVKDKDLRYICVSRSVAAMAGVKNLRDFIGKSADEMFDDRFSAKFNEDDRRVIETGEAVLHALEHIPMADGGVCLARTSKFPILNANGGAVGVYCISHDITAQKEKESQLDLLTSSIPGGLAAYSISENGLTMLYCNDGFFAFSGYTREEYMAMTAREPLALMLEEDRPQIQAMVRAFAEKKTDGMMCSCAYRCRVKSGGMRWMSMKAVLSQVGEDAFILNAVQLDITDQMELENRRLRLLDNLPFGAALFRFDGERLQAVHINKQYIQMMGRPVNAPLETLRPIDYIHPDDRQIVLDEIKDAIANGRNGSCEIRLLYGGDEYRTFRLDARIVPNDDGTDQLFVAYTRVSEQEMNFKAMLPKMFSTIMESSTDLAFAKDINFRYICCSASFAKLLNLAGEKDVIGKTDFELFPKALADGFRSEDSALFATGRPQVDILESLPSPDGTQHYIKTTKHLLRTGAGEAMGVYCTGREITEEREAYAQLKLLTNSIPGGIATFHCTADEIKLTYFNDGYCQLFGYTRDTYLRLYGGPLHSIFAEDRPVLDKQLAQLIANGTPVNCVFRVRTSSGEGKWVNCQAMAADRVGNAVVANVVLTDITDQQKEKEKLRLAGEEYRLAIAQAGRTICRYDIAAQTLTITRDVAERFALPECLPDVPYGRVRLGKISPDTTDTYIAFFESIMRGEKECSATFCKLLGADWRWIDVRSTTIFNSAGKPASAIISYTDVTEQREKEAVYSRWQNSIAERSADSYTLFRCNLSKSSSYESWEGDFLKLCFKEGKQTFDERTDEFVTQCVYAEDRERYRAFMRADTMLAEYYRGHRSDAIEFRQRMENGVIRWLRLSVDLVEYHDSSDVEAYLMYENIDAKKRSELRTIKRAETDPLTGVLNRATFAVRVNQIISQSGSGTRHALMMIDIDSFKQVNDVFGHGAGDQALTNIADLLTRASRKGDLVGRLGGDEFLLFLSDIPNEAAAAVKARQLCELTRKDFSVNVRISASIGIAVYPSDGEGFESLYKAADTVLYRVKDSGKDGYAFTHDEMVLNEDSHRRAQPLSGTLAKTRSLRRILIVDDNPMDLEVLSGIFKGEFRIEKATDGATALTKLRHYTTAISAVLLDLLMPGMNGFEVLRRIHREESTEPYP